MSAKADTLKVMHLSDIHFHEADTALPSDHRHSLPCMKAIEEAFNREKPDILIVTGDLTNLGDKASFDRVRQWLHDRINVSAQYYGLSCDQHGCHLILVPGNHDAFNASSSGNTFKRWQSSLDNYYAAFPEHVLGANGVTYFWFVRGSLRLFICALDSCYLGDEELKKLPHAPKFDRIAQGKISRKQSQELVSLYDRGMRGELKDQAKQPIAAADFMASFKLIAIHHYLFEPTGAKPTPTLHLKHRQVVFQNIAMADFDALICGHKHVADHQTHSYIDHFDPRGRIRYAFNHLRRVLGLESLPLDENDNGGRALPRNWRVIFSVLCIRRRSLRSTPSELTDQTADEVIAILRRALTDKAVLKTELVAYLQAQRLGEASLFEREEVVALHRLIQQRLSRKEFKELMDVADTLKGFVARLARRPFLHVNAGSAAKASEHGLKNRSFNVYEISADTGAKAHVFEATRHAWRRQHAEGRNDAGEFIEIRHPAIHLPFSRVN